MPSDAAASEAPARDPASPAERLARLQWVAGLQGQLSDLDFDLEAFMRTLVDRVLDVTNASGAIVELVEGDEMVYRATSSGLSQHLGLRLLRQGSLSGLCVEQNQTLYCTDSETDPRVDREACRRIGLRSMACAPILSNGRPIGVLKALAPRPNGFAAHDLEVLGLLASTLATALAKQLAFETLQREAETRRIQAEALTVARARAEAAAAANAEFLANMSHEIRTPLTAVIGFAGLLSDADMSPEARHYADRIGAAAQALLSLVNGILDLSKLQAGELELNPAPTDVAALARETLDLFEGQAAPKSVSLRLDVEPGLPAAVSVDAQALRQVLTNLLGNAVKFTDAGEVSLTIGWRHDRLMAAVRDTGAGMTLEQQARLFRRFEQASGGDAPRRGGTGLGLAISKALVEAMDGQIGVTSHAGRGSAFHFDIAAPAAATAAMPATVEPELEGVRVLVADDGPANRELVRAVLQAAGAEVVEAVDGLEAVERGQSLVFDVVLMDRRMPRLDGVGAAMRLRNEPGPNAHVPMLVFSADPNTPWEPVFDGSVSKPMSAAALKDAIAQALAGTLEALSAPATSASAW